ncbi:MAG: DnaJ domain-containing protein [Monoglobaceae bacterium]
MKWFSNPATLEELKKQYKQLVIKHHPDKGGNTADMQEINAEYDRLFELLKNTHKNAEGQTYTAQTETTETANDFKEIIEKLIRFNGIHIEICGSWVWVTGCTIEYREELKKMKFRWSKSKVAWYYHREEYRKSTKRTYTLDEIRDLYGSHTVQTEPQLKLAIV